jgi:hypothetical protein
MDVFCLEFSTSLQGASVPDDCGKRENLHQVLPFSFPSRFALEIWTNQAANP